jgi:hypothetical protein
LHRHEGYEGTERIVRFRTLDHSFILARHWARAQFKLRFDGITFRNTSFSERPTKSCRPRVPGHSSKRRRFSQVKARTQYPGSQWFQSISEHERLTIEACLGRRASRYDLLKLPLGRRRNDERRPR